MGYRCVRIFQTPTYSLSKVLAAGRHHPHRDHYGIGSASYEYSGIGFIEREVLDGLGREGAEVQIAWSPSQQLSFLALTLWEKLLDNSNFGAGPCEECK